MHALVVVSVKYTFFWICLLGLHCTSWLLISLLYLPVASRIEFSELERQHSGGNGQGEGTLHAVSVDGVGAPGPDLQVPGCQYVRASQPPHPHQEEPRVPLPTCLLWLKHIGMGVFPAGLHWQLRSRAWAMPPDGRQEMAMLQGCGRRPEVLRATHEPGTPSFKKACGRPAWPSRESDVCDGGSCCCPAKCCRNCRGGSYC